MLLAIAEFFARVSVAVLMSLGLFLTANAQSDAGLPASPLTRSQAAPTQADDEAQPAGSASIGGTVLDANQDVVQGAQVELIKSGGASVLHEVKSDGTGQFKFSNLEAGTYTVTVQGAGMSKFISKPIGLGAGQFFQMAGVVLQVARASTSVTVMDDRQASIQQVQIAEQQRVFRVFPNFYSSYDWNAPAMMSKQKYHLAMRTLFDPVTFITVGGIAGAEQYKNIFPTFGGGWEGYGKRYGAAYASHASAELLTRAVLPSIFHDDPRYFVLGKGSTQDRAVHAISSTFITRGDDGSRRFNYSEILGDLGSAALSNAYFPAQERGVNLVLVNGFGNIGGDMVDNLFREFVLNKLTTRSQKRNH